MIISDVSTAGGRQPVADLLDMARRRKMLLAIPVLAGIGIGFAGYLVSPVSYVSESVLVLDMRRLQALPSESAITPLPQDSPVLRSELDIISSRMMARKVIDILKADNIAVPTALHSRTVLSSAAARRSRRARALSIRQRANASRSTFSCRACALRMTGAPTRSSFPIARPIRPMRRRWPMRLRRLIWSIRSMCSSRRRGA